MALHGQSETRLIFSSYSYKGTQKVNATENSMTRWFVGLLLCFWFSVSTAQAIEKAPLHKAQPPAHASTPTDASAPVQVPLVPQPLIVSVRSMPTASEKSAWSDPGTYLAIATLLLVLVTWRLAEHTKRLAIDAKESGAKTMRAYVQLSSGEFDGPINQAPVAGSRELRFDLFNTGQTPARKVEFWYRLVPYSAGGKVPVTEALYFPQGSRQNPPAYFPEIGGGKHGEVRYSISDPLQLQQLTTASTAIAPGGNLVLIEGVVIYRDIYDDQDRKTFFKRLIAVNQRGLVATVDHNHST